MLCGYRQNSSSLLVYLLSTEPNEFVEVAQCPSSAHRLLQRRNLAHTFLNFLLFIVGSSLCKVGRYRRRWSDNFSIREQVRE